MPITKHLRKAAALAALGVASAQPALAAEDRDTSFSVLLNQDNFFGFYTSFNGLIEVNDDMDFSFYGIQWTSDALTFTGLSADLWTEFGAGVNLHYMDDKLTVKPQLGLLGGTLLSGGESDDDGTGANFPDGVVPSLTINYSDDTYEAEWYSGYYIGFEDETQNDFLHLWLNGGYKFSPYVSAGAHFEYLGQTEGGAEQSVYTWLGPYVQFSLPQGFFARFSAGADIDGPGVGEFYKLNVGMNF